MSSPDRIFNPEAQFELIYASEYYRNISPELKDKFIVAFEQAMLEIGDFPELNPLIPDTICRNKRVKGFPYSIIYIPDPDALYLVAVAHQSREPNYWLYRLEEPGRE